MVWGHISYIIYTHYHNIVPNNIIWLQHLDWLASKILGNRYIFVCIDYYTPQRLTNIEALKFPLNSIVLLTSILWKIHIIHEEIFYYQFPMMKTFIIVLLLLNTFCMLSISPMFSKTIHQLLPKLEAPTIISIVTNILGHFLKLLASNF